MSYFFNDTYCGVKELTRMYTEKVNNAIDSIMRQEVLESEEVIELSSYHKVFCVELKSPSHKNVIDSINYFNKLDGVLCAFPNYQITIDAYDGTATTNSIDYNTPDEIFNKISLNAAWNLVSQPSTIRVAILDTGIDANHTAFGQGINSIIDSDNSGTIRGTTYSIGNIPMDENGHGTHVAGIIAASYNTQNGHRGVHNNIEIVAIKIFDEDGRGDLSDLIDAMSYLNSLSSVDAVDIVNISAGFMDRFYELDEQDELIDLIFGGDYLVVCAAGNNNEELVTNNKFPGGLEPSTNQADNLITVGATDEDDIRWENDLSGQGSNYGEDTVDIFAPGVRILSTMPMEMCANNICINKRPNTHISNGYHVLTGTSMAAPFVTGVAALMMSSNPGLNASNIKAILSDIDNVDYSFNHNDNLYELTDLCVSGGRLNAAKAVLAAINACAHTDAEVINNGSTHTLYCNLCVYEKTESHNLYIKSEAPDDYTVACRNCNYSIDCTESPEYYGTSAEGHEASCPDGCYTVFEPHEAGVCRPIGDQDYHRATCAECGYVYLDAHTWSVLGNQALCSRCGQSSNQTPITPQNLPPLEIGAEIMDIVPGGEIEIDLPPVKDEELTE